MPTKALIGAGIGAVFAIVWATVGFGWACVVVAMSLLGAAIGYVLDRPGAVIQVLERFQERG